MRIIERSKNNNGELLLLGPEDGFYEVKYRPANVPISMFLTIGGRSQKIETTISNAPVSKFRLTITEAWGWYNYLHEAIDKLEALGLSLVCLREGFTAGLGGLFE